MPEVSSKSCMLHHRKPFHMTVSTSAFLTSWSGEIPEQQFTSETQLNVVCKFFCLFRWFQSQEKNCFTLALAIFIVHVDCKLFPWYNCCHVGNCPPVLSTSLMATAFWLVHVVIIIHMLNSIACAAVSEMFEFYGDIQGRSHFLPTTINVINPRN